MSRTYRRKNAIMRNYPSWYVMRDLLSTEEIEEIGLENFEAFEFAFSIWKAKYINGRSDTYWATYSENSKEGKRRKAKYLSDCGTHNFREPGPSWFRRMTRTIPDRRYIKRELHKFKMNPEYEVQNFKKLFKPIDYWT